MLLGLWDPGTTLCIGDAGMYGGPGNIYAGKKRWNAVLPSAALTKTSLFLPLTPDARISSVLSRAWNVQELSRERDVVEVSG